jgi:hypothetical protein
MSDFTTTTDPVLAQPSTTDSAASKANETLQNAKAAVVDNASAAYNAAANHPLTQNVKNTVANGPVAENIKDQGVKTQNEFSNLAASRTTPATPAATGQQLTHYHSFFSSLLSWDNPRASAIAFASVVLFIFGARYLDLLRYSFKLTWMVLGVTVLAEVAGKTLFNSGFTSQIRPKKYYVLPKDALNSILGDVHELINFFVIESQRIVFAENVFASLIAFVGAFISYYLIKIVPFWGLTLISTCVLFLTPLIYKTNKELIDHHVKNASNVVSAQTKQVQDLASHHASVAADATKQYASDYTAKAQELIGSRARSTSPVVAKTESTTPAYKSTDFPAAPKAEFKTTSAVVEKEPVVVAL